MVSKHPFQRDNCGANIIYPTRNMECLEQYATNSDIISHEAVALILDQILVLAVNRNRIL